MSHPSNPHRSDEEPTQNDARETITVRDALEIQRAHDLISHALNGSIPILPSDAPLLRGARQAMCWVLNHEHGGKGVELTLQTLTERLNTLGVEQYLDPERITRAQARRATAAATRRN